MTFPILHNFSLTSLKFSDIFSFSTQVVSGHPVQWPALDLQAFSYDRGHVTNQRSTSRLMACVIGAVCCPCC